MPFDIYGLELGLDLIFVDSVHNQAGLSRDESISEFYF